MKNQRNSADDDDTVTSRNTSEYGPIKDENAQRETLGDSWDKVDKMKEAEVLLRQNAGEIRNAAMPSQSFTVELILNQQLTALATAPKTLQLHKTLAEEAEAAPEEQQMKPFRHRAVITPCRYCKKWFSSNSLKNRHQRLVHEREEERVYGTRPRVSSLVCDFCTSSFEFRNKDSLLAHLHSRHHDESTRTPEQLKEMKRLKKLRSKEETKNDHQRQPEEEAPIRQVKKEIKLEEEAEETAADDDVSQIVPRFMKSIEVKRMSARAGTISKRRRVIDD